MTEKKDSSKVNLLDVMADIRCGDFVFDASTELEKMIAAVRDTKKTGTLVISLKIEPLSAGNADTVKVIDDINAKMPKPDKLSSIFFTSDDNRLLRNDPNQMKFAFANKEKEKEKE